MRLAVIVPVKAEYPLVDGAPYLLHTIRFFSQFPRVKIIVCVNGPGASDVIAKTMNNPVAGTSYSNCYFVSTHTANPYPARNAGLTTARAQGCDMFAMIDGDCQVGTEWYAALEKVARFDSPQLIMGRVESMVPNLATPHFSMLNKQGFECYGDFVKDLPVGANMVFNLATYEKLGHMDTKRSGGDGLYGIDFVKKKLGQLEYYPKMLVKKFLTNMTLRDIMWKQLQWSFDYPPEMVKPKGIVLRRLAEEMYAMSKIIDGDTFEAEYSSFVDHLFRLMLNLGSLTHHMDEKGREDG